MTSEDRQILLANIMEIKGLYDEISKKPGDYGAKTRINLFQDAMKRIERWEAGEYASEHNSGTDEDSGGSR